MVMLSMTTESTDTLAQLSVMIVEDDPIEALAVEDIVTRIGCREIHCTSRLADALELVSTLQADLGILDINLAGELVFPLAEKLEQLGMPFLLVTAYSDSAIPEKWLAKVIRKPFDPAELEFLLRKLAERTVSRGSRTDSPRRRLAAVNSPPTAVRWAPDD
jgi:two-component SAPR family response regulator